MNSKYLWEEHIGYVFVPGKKYFECINFFFLNYNIIRAIVYSIIENYFLSSLILVAVTSVTNFAFAKIVKNVKF